MFAEREWRTETWNLLQAETMFYANPGLYQSFSFEVI